MAHAIHLLACARSSAGRNAFASQIMRTNPSFRLGAAATLLATSSLASASCGSAFCSLMTDRYAQDEYLRLFQPYTIV